MKRPLQIALAIALAIGAADALALGLGTIQVTSRLNEPLVAEIPVIQASPGEAEGLIVQLASSEDFERVGLNRSRVGVPLEFALETSGGRTVIRVTTKEIVREPFLDFLVEANWPNGRLLREYTVLLDPPIMAPTRSAQARTAPAAAAEAAPADTPAPVSIPEPVVAPAPAPVAAAPEPVVQPAPSAPAPVAAEQPVEQLVAGSEYGPVADGQTLSEIARAARGDSAVTINQMMVALLRHNPDAFFQDNINALKRGAILRIPTAEEVQATAAEQEAAVVARAQIDEWRSAASPTLVGDGTSQAPAARAETPAQAVASHERVALVPPRSGDDGDGAVALAASRGESAASGNQLRSELARVAEDLETKQQEATELRSRLRDLEETHEKSLRMIALQNDQMAQLQAQLEQLRDAGIAVDDASVAATGLAQDSPDELADEPPEVVAPASADGADADIVSAEATVDATTDATTDADIDGTDGIAQADIWGNADVEMNQDTITDAGEAPLEDALDDDMAASEDVALAAAFAEDADPATQALVAPVEDAADDQPAQPASQDEAGMQQPGEPLATAWYRQPLVLGVAVLALLLAVLGLRSRRGKPAAEPRRKSIADQFGDSPDSDADRPDHADEIVNIRAQLDGNPSDSGLHLELASIYYALADREQFVAAASEMRRHVDTDGDEWLAVRSMGQELVPDEPMFDADHDAHAGAADDALDTTDFSPDIDPAVADTGPSLDYDALLDDLQSDAPLDEPEAPATDSLVFESEDGFDVVDSDAFGIAPLDDESTSHASSSLLDDSAADADAGLDFPGLETLPGSDPEPTLADAGDHEPGVGMGTDDDGFASVVFDDDVQTAGEARMIDPSDHDLEAFVTADSGIDIDMDAPSDVQQDAVDDLDALIDLPGVDADLEDGGPTTTKLDLAKAYLDMGDPDGARAMLEEVLVEGNAAQQTEARALIERIS